MRNRSFLTRLAVGVGTAVLIAAVAMVLTSDLKAQDDQPPPIDSDAAVEEPVPVEPPADGRQVLVAQFELVFEAGTLQEADLQSAERIVSNSPKVRAAGGGEWRVVAEGTETVEFFTQDPGWREAESADTESEFEWVPVDGSVEWVVVIPLFVDGERVEIERITVFDTATGEVLIDTDM